MVPSCKLLGTCLRNIFHQFVRYSRKTLQMCKNLNGGNLANFWSLINFAKFQQCQSFPPYGILNFCDILSGLGLILGNFTQKITELCCNPPLHNYPPSPTLHPYISACDVDKNNLKWRITQLAVHCGVGNLIVINSYRFIANCKPTALSLLKILHFE